MALAERMMNARYGDALVDHHTYVIAGDGCLMEGISHEAIDLAGHLKLGKLIVLWDDNHITIDGATNLSTSTDQVRRFEAAGWNVARVDGHDEKQIAEALATARGRSDKPWFIACRTTIGFGAPTRAGTSKAHGEALGPEEIAGARKALNWPYPPFVVPEPILSEWRKVSERGAEAHAQWKQRLAASENGAAFTTQVSGETPPEILAALKDLIASHVADKPKIATRKASEIALAAINGASDAHHRRLGRPDPFQPDHHQGNGTRCNPAPMAAVISITASANTAWRRR